MSYMSTVVPVRLSETIFVQLDEEARRSGLSRSEIIRIALAEHYRSQAINELRSTTAAMRDQMQQQGYESEDAIARALEE